MPEKVVIDGKTFAVVMSPDKEDLCKGCHFDFDVGIGDGRRFCGLPLTGPNCWRDDVSVIFEPFSIGEGNDVP